VKAINQWSSKAAISKQWHFHHRQKLVSTLCI